MKLSIFFLLLLISCSFAKKSHIQIIEITKKAQFFIPNINKVEEVGMDIKIAYLDDYLIYCIPVKLEKQLQNDSIVSEIRFEYNVVKKGENVGIKYPVGNSTTPLIFNVDSLLTENGFNKSEFQKLSIDLGKPYKVTIDTVTLEKYVINKKTVFDPDSIYRYYDKRMVNIDFTLSESLDKKSNSKLVKTLMVFNPIAKNTQSLDYDVPRREMRFEIRRIFNWNIKEINTIYEKFQKDKINFKIN